MDDQARNDEMDAVARQAESAAGLDAELQRVLSAPRYLEVMRMRAQIRLQVAAGGAFAEMIERLSGEGFARLAEGKVDPATMVTGLREAAAEGQRMLALWGVEDVGPALTKIADVMERIKRELIE